MKKFILLLFCFAFSITISAESGTCGENLVWTMENGILTISGTGKMPDFKLGSAPWHNNTIVDCIIEEGVTSIGQSAFECCSTISSITIPASVTSIGALAFSQCSSLTSISIPYSVTSIGDLSFQSCTSLTSINIPTSVKNIGGAAFAGCSGLTSITIPNSVKTIKSSTFIGCSSLTTITIPESVKSIEDNAFTSCSNLSSIQVFAMTPPTLGTMQSLSTITIHVYEGLRNVYCSAVGWKSYTIIDDIPLPKGINISAIAADPTKGSVTGSGTYVKGDEVTLKAIPAAGCEFQKWNDGVTVNPYVFTATENKSIIAIFCKGSGSGICGDYLTWNLEKGILTISGTGAMQDYSWENDAPWHSVSSTISAVIISEGVTSIGNSAFSGCGNLIHANLPNSLTSIGDYAFDGCSSLSSITIPNSVNNIGEFAFYDCNSLTSVKISNSVKSIRDYTFAGCGNLNSVSLPNSITRIGHCAFSHCNSLVNITMSNSVTSIGQQAFDYCTALTSIAIPSSLSSIETGAFYGCLNLKSVIISDLEKWCDIDFADNFATPACFSPKLVLNGKEIVDLVIPNGVKILKPYAFSGFADITSVSIPTSVTSIGKYAFYWCNSLSSITIPNTVTSIGECAFSACNSLRDVYNFAEIPQSINNNTFSHNENLHVLASSKTLYAMANCWRTFNIINMYSIEATSSNNDMGQVYINGNFVNKCMADEGTILTFTAVPSVYFKSWSDGNADNPREILVEKDINLIAFV